MSFWSILAIGPLGQLPSRESLQFTKLRPDFVLSVGRGRFFFIVLQFWIPAEVEGGGGNASGQGAVSKSSTSILMKMAKLPCFFVCEDSSWANLPPS